MAVKKPTLSLLILEFDWKPESFQRFLSSLNKQTYTEFELIICGPKESLSQSMSGPKIRLLEIPFNWDKSQVLEFGIGSVTGDYVCLLGDLDSFEPEAFEEVLRVITIEEPGVIYSDFYFESIGNHQLKIIEQPEFSPERLLQECFLGAQTFIKTSYFQQILSQSPLDETALYHDLMLRLVRDEFEFHRIPRPLYKVRGDDVSEVISYSVSSEVCRNHLRSIGRDDKVDVVNPKLLSIIRTPDLLTPTSVVIPTRGSSVEIHGKQSLLVVNAIGSLLKHTQHESLEIVVVYDTATPAAVLSEIREVAGDKLVLVEFKEEFNFSKKCNIGAISASGEVIVFLNDDVEIVSDNFIETLIAPLKQKGIGQVGVTMFFEDDTLQHGGHVYSHGVYMHGFSGLTKNEVKDNVWLSIDREVSGLTAACSAVNRHTFEEVGGFWEHLPGNFNDVDFSLKIRSRGYRNLVLSRLKIYHFESKTRETRTLPGELEAMHKRWGIISRDPFFPGHLND